MESRISRHLAVMSFVCACMVVAIHCTPSPVDYSWQWWIVGLLGKDGLCRIAVPWFFVASGYFCVCHLDEDGWYMAAVKKRIRTLLLPFFVWALIGLVVNWGMWYGANSAGYHSSLQNPLAEGIVKGFLSAIGFDLSRMNIGLIWYLRMVFILVLVSPVLVWLIRRLGFAFVGLMVLTYGVYDVLIHFADFWEYVISLRGIAYFTLGIAIRMRVLSPIVKSMSRTTSMYLLALGIFLIALNVALRRNGMPLLSNALDFLMVPPLLCGVWCITDEIKVPEIFVRNSFPVYVVHGTLLKGTLVIVAVSGLRPHLETSLLISFSRFVVAVILSVGIGAMLKRRIPTFAKVLFGGR